MKKLRRPEGLSITELLVSTILMGFCFAVIGELVVLNTLAATKLNNKTDGLSATRFAVERVKNDVRLGRAFLSRYDTAATTLLDDAQTLIIQQPVFFHDPVDSNNAQNGFPLKSNDKVISNIVVYKIVQDSTNPTEYLLQVSRFVDPTAEWPRTNINYNVAAPIDPAVTILRGIVGPKDPMDPTKPPQVFQYIDSTWDSINSRYSTSLVKTDANTMTNGVTVDIEIRRGTNSNKKFATTFGTHFEAYLKYNRNAEPTNL